MLNAMHLNVFKMQNSPKIKLFTASLYVYLIIKTTLQFLYILRINKLFWQTLKTISYFTWKELHEIQTRHGKNLSSYCQFW